MKRISLKKEAEVMRRLHFLLASGQGIIESLTLLELSYPFLNPMTTSLRSGKSLSSSIRNMETSFTPLTIKVIEVGELTGTLSSSLLILSDHLRHTYEIRSQIVSAMIYPAIICMLCVAMMVFLLTYILPQITPVFKSLNVALPRSTRFLIQASEFSKHHMIGIMAWIALVLILVISCVVARKMKTLVLSIGSKLPGFRNIFRLTFLVSFFRSMGIMLQSDIGVLQSVSLILETESNSYNRNVFLSFLKHIERGRSLSSFLEQYPKTFLRISHQFIRVGEQTGSLGKSCIHLSEYLEYDLLSVINRLTRLFEPAIMIFVGIMVGFISLSLISPLYELSRISAI